MRAFFLVKFLLHAIIRHSLRSSLHISCAYDINFTIPVYVNDTKTIQLLSFRFSLHVLDGFGRKQRITIKIMTTIAKTMTIVPKWKGQ